MFTIDASVHINAVNPTEEGSADSQAFLEQLRGQPRPVFSPTLYCLRGADVVYAAVARRYGATLVTRDRQQLERLPSTLPVLTPSEALMRLAQLAKSDEKKK